MPTHATGMMDTVFLSRLQFALTIGFHYLFPPLTIGLSWLIVWLLARYRQTGDEAIREMARFWVQLFGISFAVGVASGISMEFQFGTNWAGYSRLVGDVFGAPLAAEAIFAFFLESTFLAVLLFGWKRVTPAVHFVSGLLVAIGATLSAFWIIVANSWMQTPRGFAWVADGFGGEKAMLTNFPAAVFNPSTVPRYLHTVDAALVTGAFFMAGISAWFLLKNRWEASARTTLLLGLWVACIASVLMLGLGHFHAVQVARTQPAKLAAFEGLFDTQPRAPMLLFGVPDAEQATVDMAIRIPAGLSLLVSGRPDTVVRGLKDFPRAHWPPLRLTFFSFHLMVALGIFFIAFSGLGLLLHWRKRLFDNRWYLFAACLAIPLPFLANELGWAAAEVGRQPWIIYGHRLTTQAISPHVPARQILGSLTVFALVYLVLFAVWVIAIRRVLLARAASQVDVPVREEAAQ